MSDETRDNLSTFAILVAILTMTAVVWAGEAHARREWPARASELEALAAFDREAKELEAARQRLVARAQAVFAEARERLALTPEEAPRLRFDGRAWFLEDVAPVGTR